MVIDFKGAHYPKAVIVHAVFFYVRYAVSYRDLEEILAERGVSVDHATLNRWVVKYSPLIAANAQTRKKPSDNSWRMDETYIKVKGKWTYYYRAIDKFGKTLDFMLSEHRDEAAATVQRQPPWPVATTNLSGGSDWRTGLPVWRSGSPDKDLFLV